MDGSEMYAAGREGSVTPGCERVGSPWVWNSPVPVASTPVGELDVKPTPTGQIVVDFLRRKMPAYVDTGLNLVDVRDVAQVNRFAVAPLEHQFTEIFDVVLAAEAQRVFATAHLVQPGGNVGVAAELVGDVGQVEADVGGLERIESDADFVLAAAE